MVNGFKIKKYWILTFCMVFCSLVTFAQDLSDQQIGLDVARITSSLKEHGIADQYIQQEILMTREMYKSQYVALKKSEKTVMQKIKLEQSSKANTSRVTVTPDIQQMEKNVLKALYDATGGANWSNHTGWDFNTPVTSWNGVSGWYGVTLGGDGRIISLNLGYNKLSGTIPPEISKLTFLTYLDLSGNLINGTITPEIGLLSNLVFLNLSDNKLSGSIPVEIESLSKLTSLILRNNQLTSFIPTQIFQLFNLEFLDLSSNQLTGIIPTTIGNLINLKYFGSGFNPLTGNIPPQIGKLLNLEVIYLDMTQLEGNIPLEMCLLSKLKSLYLQLNKIDGSIPPEIGRLSNLTLLNLGGNQLSGSIPSEIGKLTNLSRLNIALCPITGTIPPEIGKLINLTGLGISSCLITGSIPLQVEQLTNLTGLNLSNNQLTGIIPKKIAEFSKNIYYFKFDNNNFRFVDFASEYQTYKNNIPNFIYASQLKTDSEKTVAGVSGSTITLTMCEDDRYISNVDTFQWFKNGVAVTDVSLNNRSYIISNLSAANAGDYYCVSKHPQITNSAVSDQNLILQRHPIHLTIINCTPKTGEVKVTSEKLIVNEIVNFSFLETMPTLSGKIKSTVTNKANAFGTNYTWTITDEKGNEVNKQQTTTATYGYAFNAPGKYLVKLDIADENGCPASFTKEVNIKAQVQCLNANIPFSFETTAPNLSYVWTSTNAAGDVVNSSLPSDSSLYTVSFSIPGDYVVAMVATDTLTKCYETFTQNLTIESCAPINCKVHFNFNFKIPDIKKGFGGLVLDLNSRMNIANGVVDFLKANSNKKLFATTFDMTNKGVNAVIVNKEITVQPGDVYKVGAANEISNSAPTVIRIQDNSYSNTFPTLINSGVLKNTSLKKEDIDISFFIISEDNSTSTLTAARSAYQALLASGKAKKIYFVLVNEGKFSYVKRMGFVNRKIFISPVQFLTEIMGSTPISYSATNSILNSDFVQFSKSEIANVGFKKTLNDFLQKGYDEVSSKCVDFESCTKKNINTPVIKKLFLGLANKLNTIPAGSDANTYAHKELAALAPYTVDLKPIIYNFITTGSTISFSFSNTSLENDVQLPKPLSGSIYDIDLSQYTDAGTKTPVNTVFSDGKVDISNGFVRNVDFCVKELSCVSHVALVVDESSSIDLKEINKIKKQLKSFVLQQALTNEEIGSNISVSLTGMSDSDANTRTDFIAPIRVTTKPAVLNKFYTWIDNLGLRYGKAGSGISEGSDYWNSGLDGALSYEVKADAVIMITDGCQTANTGTLQTTMKKFNNYKGNSSDLPHLYVIGIENGFYVDGPSTGKIAARNEDPNYNSALQKRSLTGKVTARLTKSLQYLLGFSTTEFPVANINDFKAGTYFGHDNFNLLASDETYISDKLADSEIICGESGVKDFCDDCFSFKPEPDHEYLLSAWVKEESFTQVKSYVNSVINIVFYRQKEALDIPGQIIATEIAVPTGEIIDGWQRIVKKIKVPLNTVTIGFSLENKSASIPIYFDDIRIHPLKGSVKSFVYDPETFKLMSELDENNYSTFYEYDNEGGLVRVKKETAKGIKTIQETRSGSVINTKE